MHLKALPLFVSLVVGLAAPDPSPAPDADLVADLLERQITASAPGVGATVNSESACANLGPISGCIDSGGASGAIPGASGTIGSDGATITAESSTIFTSDGTAIVSVSQSEITFSNTASDTTLTTSSIASLTTSDSDSASSSSGLPVATDNAANAEGRRLGLAAAGVAVGGVFVGLL